MKTYCRGLVIGRPEVERAYEAWLEAPSGKKNAWRVAREHGSAAALIDELASEIRGRTFLRGRRAFRSFARAPTLAGARRVCSYYGIFKNADCADLMRREHMHSLAARARRMVSENDRRKEE